MDNASNETGFWIERSWNGSTGWHQFGTVAANVTTYTHQRQPALTTCYYRVRATNAAGESAYSNVAWATTLGYVVPGTLDPAFRAGGVATTPIGQALEMALQPDGKIVLGGQGNWQPGLGWASVIARYLPNGSLDPGFGSGGSVELPRPLQISGIALGSDGEIVAAASLYPFDCLTSHMAVVRLTPSGALDASFGSGGVAQVDFLGKTYGADVAL